MKFVVERAAAIEPLQRAARVAIRGNANTIPMLSHVRIEGHKNGKATLVATDMDREVEVTMPTTSMTKPGVITANARAILDFVNGAPEGSQIEFEHPKADARLIVRAGTAKAAFATLPAEDFPRFKATGDGVALSLDGAAFAAALASVAHAQANEETRYYLNGVYLHGRGGNEVICVATDGHRLARATMKVDQVPEGMPGVIVPSPTIAEIMTMAAKVDTIEISIDSYSLSASAGGVVFRSKLIDGTFPDYERVIPARDIATGFDADRNAFAIAAKRCAAIVSDKMRSLKLTPHDRSLELLGRDTDRGEITDEIDVQPTTKLPVGVNSKYLAGALDALQGTTVRVRYADAGSPLAITDPNDDTRLQIVMPVRV